MVIVLSAVCFGGDIMVIMTRCCMSNWSPGYEMRRDEKVPISCSHSGPFNACIRVPITATLKACTLGHTSPHGVRMVYPLVANALLAPLRVYPPRDPLWMVGGWCLPFMCP
jgi:hypothetical protein